MGAAVIGGLVASTALSLFVVPVIYTLIDDFEHFVRRKRALSGRRTRLSPARRPRWPDRLEALQPRRVSGAGHSSACSNSAVLSASPVAQKSRSRSRPSATA